MRLSGFLPTTSHTLVSNGRFSSRLRPEKQKLSAEDVLEFHKQGYSFNSIRDDFQRVYKKNLKALKQVKNERELQTALKSFFQSVMDLGQRVLTTAGLVTENTENPFGINYGHLSHEFLDPLGHFRIDSNRLVTTPDGKFLAKKQRIIQDFKNVTSSCLSVLKIYSEIENKKPEDFSGNLSFFWRNLVHSSRHRYQRVGKVENRTDKYKIVVSGLKHLKLFERTTLNNPYEIYIVLRNMMTNAIKYSNNKGKIGVQFLTGWGMDSSKQFRRYLMATVSDSGVGVPPEEAYRIMTGKRASNVVNSYPGQAYGFQEATRLVHNHNGAVFMASPTRQIRGVPKGTQVQVFFPLVDTDSVGSTKALPGLPPGTPNSNIEKAGNLIENTQQNKSDSPVSSSTPKASLVAFYADKANTPPVIRYKVTRARGKKGLTTTIAKRRASKPTKTGQKALVLAK